VTGKARTFQPDDSDQVYTSIRPESIATVDADTRDRWVVSAAEQTLDRIGTYAGSAELDLDGDALTDALLEAGVESGLAAGIPLAQEHYGTTPSYLAALRACALEAVEVVAGERDQVSGLTIAPDTTSPEYDATFASLTDLDGVDTDALEASAEPEPELEATAPVAATTDGSGTAAADPEDTHSGSAAGTATSDDPATTDIDAGLEAEAAEPDAESDDTDESDSADDSPEAEPDSDETASEVDDEPVAVAASESDDSDDETDDELGDFDAGDVDDGMYEMDESEREQLEEEFGTEFTAGSDVDEPGEAGIDVPEPEDAAADELEAESELGNGTESDGTTISVHHRNPDSGRGIGRSRCVSTHSRRGVRNRRRGTGRRAGRG